MMKVFVFISIFFLVPLISKTQSLTELQKRKNNTEKEIEYTTQLIEQTFQKEQVSLNRLYLINNNILQRNRLIEGLTTELDIYKECIENNTLAVSMMTKDLADLKMEYASLIRLTYVNKNYNSYLLFLLSAENFNQAFKRMLYMKRYISFRQKQAEKMKLLQNVLNEKVEKLKQLNNERVRVLNDTRNEKKMLDQEKEQRNKEIQKLKKEQRDLNRILKKKRKIEQQLEREIIRVVEEEARKKRDAGEPAYALTPEQKLMGENFEQNRLRLPWPVERGVITEHFGIHRHAVLKNVKVRNNGIDIATEPGAEVRTVFNGQVTRVFGITGGNTAVIIRHGQYLSVYSNLNKVIVKKGDKVKTKQVIGNVFTDYEEGNKSTLKFQIWKENQKLNPEEWIGR